MYKSHLLSYGKATSLLYDTVCHKALGNGVPRYVTAVELAQLMDVHPKTVYEWIKYGAPRVPIGGGGALFDPDKVKEWATLNGYGTGRPGPRSAEQRMKARAAGVEGKNPYTVVDGIMADGRKLYDVNEKEDPETGELLTPEQLDKLKADTMAAKLRKEQLMAEKYEHQLKVARAELVSTEEVRRERLQRIAAVKAKLLALPGKLAVRLAGRDAKDIQLELEHEVRECLAEFARGEDQAIEEAA